MRTLIVIVIIAIIVVWSLTACDPAPAPHYRGGIPSSTPSTR